MIKDIETLKTFFREKVKTPVFGVGVYAFNRLGLADVIPDFRVLALRYSLDTELIEKDIEVFPLEKGMGTKHIKEPRNATTVIRHPRTEKYLRKFKNPALIVYKSSSRMEKICQQRGWNLIAVPVKFGKTLFENKVKFRRILEEIGVPVPPGRIKKPRALHYGHLMNNYGLPFVIQHPTRGGGKGTFFIRNKDDFDQALKKLKIRTKEGQELPAKEPEEVIVTRFIKGPSPSITGCVTRHGILSTCPQMQILDIPELFNPERGSGLFCGHDWDYHLSENIKRQAYSIVEKIGKYFRVKGYKGIFGLDFVMDEKEEKLYVTETNPRLLATFPTITMVQLRNNEPPIMAFHLLEYLNIDYDIDVARINQLMRQPKQGAQMFLHNLSGGWARNYGEIRAGAYRLNPKLQFVRSGYALKHLKNEDEFLVTEGVPFKKSHFSPNRRLCRILTLKGVLEDYTKLNDWGREVVTQTYRVFDIRPVKFIKLRKFFSPHFLAKG